MPANRSPEAMAILDAHRPRPSDLEAIATLARQVLTYDEGLCDHQRSYLVTMLRAFVAWSSERPCERCATGPGPAA